MEKGLTGRNDRTQAFVLVRYVFLSLRILFLSTSAQKEDLSPLSRSKSSFVDGAFFTTLWNLEKI